MAPLATMATSPNSNPQLSPDCSQTVMDSEFSTDGENSLLSGSGPETASTSGLQQHGRNTETLSPFGDHVFGEQPSESAVAELEQAFYFETDHIALKGNPDYHVLLRTVALLESQRQQAIKDLDKLVELRQDALANPIGFVDQLQRKVDMGTPRPQQVAELPQLDWDRYTTHHMESLSSLKQPKHMTRHTFKKHTDDAIIKSLGSAASNTSTSKSATSLVAKTDSGSWSNSTALTNGNHGNAYNPDGSLVVRGRLKDQTKPETFNKLWTIEEQHRLEELLVKHPSEEVEMKRFTKIAKELGNRTTKQVASRVQKYFIKLAKAGLPIPGRMPSVHGIQSNSRKIHRHHRNQKLLFPPSTFLASHEPPVYMTEDDDDYDDSASYAGSGSVDWGDTPGGSTGLTEISDDEDISPELRDSDAYRELLRLKRLRREKQCEAVSKVQHIGYKCDRCDCEPIIGVRWHCTDCPKDTSTDFCDNCADFVYETRTHRSSHHVMAIQEAESLTSAPPHVDKDYTKLHQPGDYNYLDPNYMPAT